MTTDSPRIPYVDFATLDSATQAELRRCAAEGTPRPESSAVRAHSPRAFWAFASSWDALFRSGVVNHELKELCRVYVSRSVKCEYCGNQRSEAARGAGLAEAHLDDLMNFEAATRYSDRERAALAYAEAITWRLEPTDELWARLGSHFSNEELVELGCFISLTMGQQSWIRLLGLDHQRYLVDGAASRAGLAESVRAGDGATLGTTEGHGTSE
ncbi:MAG: carboxymuconolactone decarboxylase family protein [Acidimicrobiales bacterium]